MHWVFLLAAGMEVVQVALQQDPDFLLEVHSTWRSFWVSCLPVSVLAVGQGLLLDEIP